MHAGHPCRPRRNYLWNSLYPDRTAPDISSGLGVACLNVAIYDAMIAARDSEYTYNRRHPGEVDPGFTTVIANPRSSSYPSEHAVAAGAASAVLAYIFPDCAAFFAEQAEAAGRSLLLAGVAYPSDVEAGLELPPHAQEQLRCSLLGIRGWRPAHFSVLGPNPRASAFRVSDGLGCATSRSRLRHSLDHVPRRWRRVLGCKIQLLDDPCLSGRSGHQDGVSDTQPPELSGGAWLLLYGIGCSSRLPVPARRRSTRGTGRGGQPIAHCSRHSLSERHRCRTGTRTGGRGESNRTRKSDGSD